MTEPFDWAGLWTGAHAEAYVGHVDNEAAAAYLRTRIEAAFVPVERSEQLERIITARDAQLTEEIALSQKYVGLWNQATARAEAAEARVKALEEALQRIDDLDSKDEGDMPMMEAAAWNGALEVCRTIAFKALGGEHDK